MLRFDGLEEGYALGNDATEIFVILRVRVAGLRFCIRYVSHGIAGGGRRVVVERQRQRAGGAGG